MQRVAVIGLGYWGPNLVRNFAACEQAELAAVCDLEPARTSRIKRQFPYVWATQDPDEIFGDDAIDAVAIATPVHTHFGLARRALQAGKHVLVEKPLTADVAQAETLVDLAATARRVLMVDHTFVYTPAVNHLRDLVRSGTLGDIYYFDSVRVNLGLFQHDTSVIWDLAPHDISIMQYVLGRSPRWVTAIGACHAGQRHVNQAYLSLELEGGILAHVHVNWLAPVKTRTICIAGTRRMAVFDDNEPSEKVKVYDRGVSITSTEGIYQALVQYRRGDMHAVHLPATEALAVEVAQFLEAIETGIPSPSDGQAGLEVVRVLAAAEQSLQQQGRRIRLETPVLV